MRPASTIETPLAFGELFGRPPEAAADAPGRVNIIGEHTDYSGGYVLPTPIPQRTTAEVARREDGRVRAWSANLSVGRELLEYVVGAERRTGGWLDYVQGVTVALRGAGHAVGGFDLRLASEVPPGGGVSSSAALEVALLRALRQAFGLSLDDIALARLGQQAENDFVGAPVGIMDQMAASVGEEGSALFLDTRSLRYERVPLPAAAELVVIDSGVKHEHAGGEYRVRRREVEEAARLLGVERLGDLDVGDLPLAAALPPPLDRRVRHVLSENQRVLEAVEALRAGDLERLGKLLGDSHRSLRDDYEVSAPELDLLVELAAERPEVYGARLTGGGFGGCVVLFARAGQGAAAAAAIAAAYAPRSGRPATVLVPRPRPAD